MHIYTYIYIIDSILDSYYNWKNTIELGWIEYKLPQFLYFINN